MGNWSLGRVIALGIGWMVLLILVAAIRSEMQRRALQPQHPGTDIYVMLRIPGGRWFLLGPPVLLLLAWLLSRATHRA